MRLLKLISLFLVLSSLVACDGFGTIWMYRLETNCSDPWPAGKDLIENSENVTTYIESKGIKVYECEVNRLYSTSSCQACTCPNGNRIAIRIDEDFRVEMEALGFDIQG